MTTPSKPKRLNDDDLMPFGVHKGKRLAIVPDDYWRWFLSQSWCDQWPALVAYANVCFQDE